jgi:tetratricopeptide (TPR) repeat protein
MLLSFSTCTFAVTNAQLFIEGVKNYKDKEYAEAANKFLTIHEKGINSGKLFYNIGNTYFKNGENGRAILWYERALKLIPNDPDLNYNYRYVNGLLKDQIPDISSPVLKILFFWKDLMGKKAIKWTGIILLYLTCIIVVIRQMKGKKIFNSLCVTAGSLALLFIITSLYDTWCDKFVQQGVIIETEAAARSGLSEDATVLFTVHEGIVLKITRQRNDYYKISLKDGKIGWINSKFIEII